MVDPVPTWADGSGGGTPLTAANLNQLSTAVRDLQSLSAFNDRGTVAASTSYAVGDLVTYFGKRILIKNAVTSGSNSFISFSNYDGLSYLQVVDVREFGAAVDGSTDDTAAIRNAVNYFGTNGGSSPGSGGVVTIPPGYMMTSGTIDLPTGVWLRGAGKAATVIQLLPNSNCHMITTHRSTGSGDANAYWAMVSDLMLDGRRANQGHVLTDVTMRPGFTTITSAAGTFQANGTVITGIGIPSGTTISSGGGTNSVVLSQAPTIAALQQRPGAGIVYQGGTTDLLGGNPIPWCGIYHETNPYNSTQNVDTQFDPTHLFQNLRIYFMQGDGIRIHGRSDCVVRDVKVSFATNNGFTIDFDTSVQGCLTEYAHANGLEIPGHGSDRVSNNKFYNSYQNGIYTHGGGGDLTMVGNDLQENCCDGVRIESQDLLHFSGTVSQSGFSNGLGGEPRQTTWAANTAYGSFWNGPNADIVVPTVPNGFVYGCYIAGTSGASQPTFPTTVGNTVVDGTVTWVCMANAPAAVSLIGSNHCVVDVTTGGDLNGLRITGSSVGNTVTLGHNSTITGAVDVSSDTITLPGSGNSVKVNGVSLTDRLAGLTDVNISSPSGGQVLNYNSGTGKWINSSAGATVYGGLFGTGQDGSATLDGTATVSWASKSGSTYTMIRDCHVGSLTINSGVTLKPAGFRIFCQGTVTNAGTISHDGNAGLANGTAGAQTTSPATLFGGSHGGDGATGSGNPGGADGSRLGVNSGGSGGTGSSGSGGSQGFSATSDTTSFLMPQVFATGVIGWNLNANQLGGGPGGGGGGGDGTNKGGGGGSGGGVVGIAAHAIVNNGTMSVKGGNGGTPTTGNCGGGGGGAGGLILGYTLAVWTAGTTTVTGGTAGSGVGTGSAGSSGGAGSVLNVVVA